MRALQQNAQKQFRKMSEFDKMRAEMAIRCLESAKQFHKMKYLLNSLVAEYG
jgi:CRISPR/Cas system-associated protein endoribonuclease Cas2